MAIVTSQPRSLLSEAVEAFQGQDQERCLSCVEEVLALQPGEKIVVPALLLKARVLLAAGGLEGVADLCRQVLALQPRNLEALMLLGRCAVKQGDTLAAFNAFRRVLRQRPENSEALGHCLRLLARRKRYRVAHRLGQVIEQNNMNTTTTALRAEAALGVVEPETCLKLVEGDSTQSPMLQQYRKIAESMLRERAPTTEALPPFRHIAIGGVSFVGSTIFGVMLGSVEGVSFAGETHWLTTLRTANGAEPLDPEDTDVRRWPIACRICNRDCEVFTPDFRRSLARNTDRRYQRIAQQLSAKVLVTSDKNAPKYWLFDPLFGFDLVVLYKSPESQIRSVFKQELRKGDAGASMNDAGFINGILDNWCQNYLGLLKIIRPQGRRLVLNWERFVAEPRQHFDRLLRLLDLPGDASALDNLRLGHFIGGNIGVDVKQLQTAGRIEIRPSNAPPLSDAAIQAVQRHREARYVHKLLDKEYQRAFEAPSA